MAHYEQALRQIRYRNWRPATLSQRKFRVTCSELNGRYTSNEFILEMSLLHHSAPVEHPNHMAALSQFVRPVHHPLMIHSFNSHMTGPAPPAATVVIVVCIAALVVIVVIGVYRIHATHQEGSREDEDEAKDCEMDWDNSGLTITVNPMENISEAQAVAGEVKEECEDDEEDEEEQVAGLTSTDSENTDEDEQEDTSRVTKLKWDSCSGTY